jgi:hypothetical protein
MYSHLLTKALPFTLTLILGSGLAGMFKPHRPTTLTWTLSGRSTPLLGREGPFGELHEHRHVCDMRRHNFVAESKPLVILFKPDALLPRGFNLGKDGFDSAWVRVTFGADGKVQEVEQLDDRPREARDAAERAARRIEFEPETINAVPVSVTKEVEIRFLSN